MKKIYCLLFAAAGILCGGCVKADPEFVHTGTMIQACYCVSKTYTTQQVAGAIYEFDKDGNEVYGDALNEKSVEGGYGLIIFNIPNSLKRYIDIKECKVNANTQLDQFITPPLTGLKDISGDGIIVCVEQKSAGTYRYYRIKGQYND